MKNTGKPYTRWWWFSGAIDQDVLIHQLEWLKNQGFGGIEIAWVYPLQTTKEEKVEQFLSEGWSQLVIFVENACKERDLGCDFTFGTLWPFGGSFIPEKYASKTYHGLSQQRLHKSWEVPYEESPGLILDHINREALVFYSQRIADGLKYQEWKGVPAFFMDSWEVDTHYLWADGFSKNFFDTYGYSIEDHINELYKNSEILYDYRKLRSKLILKEFFQNYTEICHTYQAVSRVQAHGAPADIIEAYSLTDIPETEAILFDPDFSRFAFSAAALTEKPIVSCEAFTCMYGWKQAPGPAPYIGEEYIPDLKILADALFAHGVNHIVWHGMPYNPPESNNRFYASVHVGPDGALAPYILRFNAYMEKVSLIMREGSVYTTAGCLLPLEDQFVRNELPQDLQKPSSRYYWEFQECKLPEEIMGWNPIWVSLPFLKEAQVYDDKIYINTTLLDYIYLDVEWMDYEVAQELVRLQRHGAVLVIPSKSSSLEVPKEPGRIKHHDYDLLVNEIINNAVEKRKYMKEHKPLIYFSDISFQAPKGSDIKSEFNQDEEEHIDDEEEHNEDEKEHMDTELQSKSSNFKKKAHMQPDFTIRKTGNQKIAPQHNDSDDYTSCSDKELYRVFIAHPSAKGLRYPLSYRYSDTAVALDIICSINIDDFQTDIPLKFDNYGSKILSISASGHIKDITEIF